MKEALTTLTRGVLAKRSGVGVETIRFYEKEGLLPPPARDVSGYRRYRADTVAVLRFIKRAKELGFTLKEVAELLELREDWEAPCADVHTQATQKIEQIEGKIDTLVRLRDCLQRLADACAEGNVVRECPIMDFMMGEDPSIEDCFAQAVAKSADGKKKKSPTKQLERKRSI